MPAIARTRLTSRFLRARICEARSLLTSAAAASTLVLACNAATASVEPLRLEPEGPVFPGRSIRLVVPFPPGASTDSIARIIAEPVGDRLGQNVNVTNRTGAGGNIGAETVVRSLPDGHTWLMGTAGLMSINALLYPHLGFDPALALVPVALVARVPFVLVVHPSMPVHSLDKLIEFTRRRPWILNYGSAGTGSLLHLGMELFKAATGTQLVHIPYRGGAPASSDLIGGHIHMMLNSVPLAMPHIESKRLRPIAVTTAKRSRHLPDLPTMVESGLEDVDFSGWFALFVPARTPARLVVWLNQTLVPVLSNAPLLRARIEAIGAEPETSTPAQVHELMRRDTTRWKRVIETAKVKPDWQDYPQ
jgi:tripartite-type tricarboxylate transporter receptor subunit TctC